MIIGLASYLLWPSKDGSGIPEIAGKGPGQFAYTQADGQRRDSDEKALLSMSSDEKVYI